MALFKQVIPCGGGVRRDVDTDLIKAGEWYSLSGFETDAAKIVRGPGLDDVLDVAPLTFDTYVAVGKGFDNSAGTTSLVFLEKSKCYVLTYNPISGWFLTDKTGSASFTITAPTHVVAFMYNSIMYFVGSTLGWYKLAGSSNIAAISGATAGIAGGAFFDHLVAVNISGDARAFAWAAEGSETAWTPATTNDAGAFSITQTPGINLAFLVLGKQGVVYKNDGIALINYVGGNEVFAIGNVLMDAGIYNPACVVEAYKGLHAGFGRSGPFLFDGTNVDTAFADPVRDAIEAEAGSVTRAYAQVQYLRRTKQLLVAYPSASSYVLDRSYKYSFEDKLWTGPHYPSYKRLTQLPPEIGHITSGLIDYMVDSGLSLVTESDSVYLYKATAMTMLAETGDIPLWVDAIDANGQLVPLSHTDVYQIQAIHLELYTAESTKSGLRVYVSTRMALDDAVTYGAAQAVTYTATGVIKINYRATGRWVRLKFDINENKRHEIRGYKIEFTRVGRGR